jgi:hypothetical protein
MMRREKSDMHVSHWMLHDMEMVAISSMSGKEYGLLRIEPGHIYKRRWRSLIRRAEYIIPKRVSPG